LNLPLAHGQQHYPCGPPARVACRVAIRASLLLILRVLLVVLVFVGLALLRGSGAVLLGQASLDPLNSADSTKAVYLCGCLFLLCLIGLRLCVSCAMRLFCGFRENMFATAANDHSAGRRESSNARKRSEHSTRFRVFEGGCLCTVLFDLTGHTLDFKSKPHQHVLTNRPEDEAESCYC